MPTDNFNRADGGLGANWTKPTPDTVGAIVSQAVGVTVATEYTSAVYTGTGASDANQSSKATFPAISAYVQLVTCRHSITARTWYAAGHDIENEGGAAILRLLKRVANVYQAPLNSTAITLVAGDIIELIATGTSPVNLLVKRNGTQVINFNDSTSPITTGGPGFFIEHSIANVGILDDWEGGNLGPSITVVSGTNVIANGQTATPITGSAFGATQGAGLVELADSATYAGATKVTQTVTSWSATAIQITVDLGSLTPGILWLYVTDNPGARSSAFPVIVNPVPATPLYVYQARRKV